MAKRSVFVSGIVVIVLAITGCGGGDEEEGQPPSGSPEQTGATCEVAADCFPNVDHEALHGEIRCLERVRHGYCTHLCESDADCCAVKGECDTDLRQVCSPFESTGLKMCFLSCESSDLGHAAEADGASEPVNEQVFCQREASADFLCRSSGGGSQNRKICVPGQCGVGAACRSEEDCDANLTCLTGYRGGYCGKADCTVNADCPAGSQCVRVGENTTACLRTCTDDFDCSFCRGHDVAAVCTHEVQRLEGGTAPVCVPDR